MVILDGNAPDSRFEAGWYQINLVYFHLLAESMWLFGTTVAGTRTLSAIVGLACVVFAAWIGGRHFGWRLGLLATALVTAGAFDLQSSRFISEAEITALLWAVSVAGFLVGGQNGRRWAFALAGLAGGLSLYFYPASRLWAVGAAITVVALYPRSSSFSLNGRWGCSTGIPTGYPFSQRIVLRFHSHWPD